MREKLPNSKESSGLHRNDIVGGISLCLYDYWLISNTILKVCGWKLVLVSNTFAYKS